MRAGGTLDVDHAVPVGLVRHDVVLRVGVRQPRQHLRVGGDHMEGLDERVLGHLPVAGQHLRDVQRLVAVLQRPDVVLVEGAAIALEGLRVRVHVDEDEAAPGRHLGLGERELLRSDMREVPGTGRSLHGAVEVPGETVERAAELADVAAAGAQLAAAVQAHVDVRADLVGGRPYDDQRVVADLVDLVVADLRDLALQAGELPHASPHLPHLAFRPFAGDEARGVDVLAADVVVPVVPQGGGNGAAVLVEVVLDGGPGAPRGDRLRRFVHHLSSGRNFRVSVVSRRGQEQHSRRCPDPGSTEVAERKWRQSANSW